MLSSPACLQASRCSHIARLIMKRRRPTSHQSLALSLALLFTCKQIPADAFAAAGRPASDPATVAELSDVLGMTVKQTQRLIRSTPSKNFERQYIVNNAQHMLHYLTEERSIMSKDQTKKLIQKSPSMLTYSPTNIEQTTDFFLSECRLSKEEYVKMLMTYPACLGLSIENSLRPAIDFFRDEIGSNKWKWIVVRYPQIFRNARGLQPRAKFMYEKLKLKRRADLSQIASKYPPSFWLSEENIVPKMEFLQQTLELSAGELRDILVTYPQLLGLSLEGNLRPTVEFLLNDDGADLTVSQLRYFMSYQPALLAYSLEKRIRPRIERMRDAGIRLEYSPPVLMSYTDSKFDIWLEKQTTTWSIS